MKKRDYILIIGVLAAAFLMWFLTCVFQRDAAGILKITVDGREFGTYALDLDQDIAIGDTNTCRICKGAVSMITADCPDLVCVHSMRISRQGQTIICMPNKVVLEIIEGDSAEVDTVSE